MAEILKNPLIPGFYPDPSVCRRGEDYYLITSSFEYFPGIPIFHSKDFVHWHQLGHVLSRPEQLNLDGVEASKGIYASSIFYQKVRKRFYVVSTLVKNASYQDNMNFLVWAENPEGPWSDPIVIKGAEGIDPSLYFEGEDAYYIGNRRPVPQQPEKGRHIWLQKLNLDTGELTGERQTLLTQGAFAGAAAPEGPHIYHIGNWYYLLIAEGGTFRNHASTIFRSKNLAGPYEIDPKNPLITHRNLRSDYPIKNPGHADMIQLHNGEWWAVLLATRTIGGAHGSMGRETFAVPVLWEQEWPLFSPDTGHVEFSYPAPKLEEKKWAEPTVCEQFDEAVLPHSWITVRTPRKNFYSLTKRPGFLRLFLDQHTIKDQTSCAFLGVRQRHMCYCITTVMEFMPKQEGESSGILLLMNSNFHIRLEYGMVSGKKKLCLITCFAGQDRLLGEMDWDKKQTYLKVNTVNETISFYVSDNNKDWLTLSENVDGSLLGRDIAGGYTGTILGLYATSNGSESDNFADFDWFEYDG